MMKRLPSLSAAATSGVAVLAAPMIAWAADAKPGAKQEPGMPQLDSTWYASQVFWLAVTFIIFLLLCWKVILPKIDRVLEDRNQRIQGDLEQARELRDEADKVLADYEAALADARSKAQAAIREAANEAQTEATDAHQKLGAKLAEQVSEAEERIAAARTEAVGNVKGVAEDLAKAAAEKLLGSSVAAGDAQSAVASVLGNRS